MKKIKKQRFDEEEKESEGFSFTRINKYELDSEWVEHVNTVGYYSKQLAAAKMEYEQAKAAASVFEAETARRVRAKPKNYSVGRLTEAAIKEAVSVELLYSKEHDAVIQAKYKVDMLEGAMRTLEHRKKALSDLVYLHGQDYFAQPKIPKNGRVHDKIRERKENQIRGLRDED